MRAILTQLFVSYLLLTAVPAPAAPGDVDPTFVYPQPVTRSPDSTNAIPLADGFLVVKSLNFGIAGRGSTLELTRIDEDGRVVPTYGNAGTVTIVLPAALNLSLAARRLANGRILLAGYQKVERPDRSGNDSDTVAAVARLDENGRLDEAFGVGGVATVDVQGDLDRVGAVDALPDGRIVAGIWSRFDRDPYDCDPDRVELARLPADGSSAQTLFADVRTAFSDNGCRRVLNMQVLDHQEMLYPSGWAIFFRKERGIIAWTSWDDADDTVDTNGLYGPFVFDPETGFAFLRYSGSGQLLARGDPSRPNLVPTMGSTDAQFGKLAGIQGSISATLMVADRAPTAWYVGFSNDSGQVGIAKFLSDGSLDPGWGGGDGVVPIVGSGTPDARDGVLYATHGLAADVRMISVRRSGNLVVATADGVIQRLVGTSLDLSHGGLALRDTWPRVSEGDSLTLAVARKGGTAGAVSVEYRVYSTTVCDPLSGVGCTDALHRPATTDDFVASTGRLDWADGDGEDRSITIRTRDDSEPEPHEMFWVELESPTNGAVILSARTEVAIVDNDKGTIPVQPPPAKGNQGSGGGGAATWPLLALLGVLVLVRRRADGLPGRRWIPHEFAACTNHCKSVQALVLALSALGISGSAYGRAGDMDPSFGNQGVLRIGQFGLPLQDGRLLYRTSNGYGRMDVDGRPDPAFGIQGVQDWPAGFNPGNGYRAGVSPSAWARTRDGALLAAGTVRGAGSLELAVVKLRADGIIDRSFGTDGMVRVPSSLLPAAETRWIEQELVVQQDGRILVLTELHRDVWDFIVDMELARLLPDGAPDSSFGTGGIVKTSAGNGSEYVVLDALKDGRIRLSGDVGVFLSSSGALDSGTPRDDPELGPPARSWAIGSPTADGGVIVISSEGDPDYGPPERYFFAKLNADGTVDRTFGPMGSGVVEVSRSANSVWTPEGHACSSDGRFLLVSLTAGPYRQAVARYRTKGPGAGTLDPDFGEGGVVNLGRIDWIGSFACTSDGGLLISNTENAFRLLGVDRRSPGYASLASDQPTLWREDLGPIEMRFSRLAGSNGQLRVRYSTMEGASSAGLAARAGVDFEPVSGELVWSDGDVADKTISIPLLTDSAAEPTESLKIALSVSSETGFVWREAVYMAIMDSPASVSPPPASPPPTMTPGPGNSGGGGSGGLTLLCLLAAVRRIAASARIAA